MRQLNTRAHSVIVLVLVLLVTALVPGGGLAYANGNAGAVYVMSNSPAGNEVLIFDRAADGGLTPVGSVATGGAGGPLGSQGALVLSEDLRWLLAVNAGSDQLSVFAVGPDGLSLVSNTPSGGDQPVSVTIYKELVYVLNAGSNEITGFTIDPAGVLTPIPDSTRTLGGAAPAQVSFSPDGNLLVVTARASQTIDLFTVNADGTATGPTTHHSEGATPFGFGFGHRNVLIVSEAGPGAVSSYRLSADGGFEVASSSVTNTQRAACWIVVTKNGRYAYSANAGSSSISGYHVAPDGTLTLLDADGRTGDTGEGTAPVDMALSNNSQYLYVVNNRAFTLGAFEVGADGSLTPLAGTTSLPAGAGGIAAR